MAAKTFIVERNNAGGETGTVEIKAERGEQEAGSTRVTFYNGSGDKAEAVASFINIQAWYEKPSN